MRLRSGNRSGFRSGADGITRGSYQTYSQVLAAASTGDGDAITRLYLDHVAMVHGYLRACGEPDVDDATSEVFVGMLRGLARFEGGPSEFRSWLMTIAHRRLVDQRRHRGRRPAEPIEPWLLDAGQQSRQPGEAAALIDRELIVAFAALTDGQRQVLALRFLADASIEEVASITSRPVASVKSLQSRGLAALRRHLQPAPTLRYEATP